MSFEQITEAHRDLVQVWHPDRFEHNPRLRRKAEEELKSVQEAFSCLKAHRSQPHSNNKPDSAVAVRESHSSQTAVSGAFELTPEIAQRLFKRVFDGKLVNHASTVPLPKRLYIAGQFGVRDAADIRLLIVSLEGPMNSGCVLTKSAIRCRGFLNKADIPFNSISKWEFKLLADGPNLLGDRLWARMSGRELQLLSVNAYNGQDHESSNIKGGSDAQTQLIHEAVLALQKQILGS